MAYRSSAVASAATGAITATPVGVQAGDYLGGLFTVDNAVSTAVLPAGWSQQASVVHPAGSPDGQTTVYADKVAAGGDSFQFDNTVAVSSARALTTAAWSGRDTINPRSTAPITTLNTVANGPNTVSATYNGITASQSDDVGIFWFTDQDTGGERFTSSTITNYTKRQDGVATDWVSGIGVQTRDNVNAGATGNFSATLTDGAFLARLAGYGAVVVALQAPSAAASGMTMGNTRPASRFTGPVVQRFNFRQPNQLGRDPTLSPPEQIVQQGMTAVRPGNKFVGPQVLRQRFQVPQRAIATSTNVELIPTVGSIVVGGNAPTLLQVLGPSEGSIVVGGNAPSILSVLIPTAGGIVVGGNAPALLLAFGATSGSIIVGGNAPGLFSSLAPSTGSIVIDGYAPTISVGVILNPPEGSIVIGGNSPTLLSVLSPTQGSVIIGGNVPSIARLLSPTEGAVIVGGNTPSMALLLGPAEGAILISGNAPTLLEFLVPGSGAIVIGGQVPDVVVFGGDQFLAPAEGLIIVDGNAPGLLIITPFVEQVGGSGGGGGGGGDPGRGGARRNRPFKAVGKRRFILNGQVEGHTTLVKVVKTEVTKEDLAELTPDEQAAILAFIATL